MEKVIVHISEVSISPESGMGRVEYFWEKAIRKAGFDFIHIGPKEMGKVKHKGLFPLKAYQCYKEIKRNVVAVIVHEPLSMFFVNKGVPVFIESHGVERRNWESMLKDKDSGINFKTRILFPIWRLLSCDIGLKKANKLLLINNDDKNYVIKKYQRSVNDIYIFKNGVNYLGEAGYPEKFTVLFNGSWIKRKGIQTLVDAAIILKNQSLDINYLLIGTGKTQEEVLNDWPEELRSFVKIVPKFYSSKEQAFLSDASIVVLPSNFEGQPLSILQAMAAGKCCVTTNSCGQKDFIINGANGLLFEKHDATTFANLIKDCYYNIDYTKKIGINAMESMKGRSWEKMSDDLVSFISGYIK